MWCRLAWRRLPGIGQAAFKGIRQVCCSEWDGFRLDLQQFLNAFLQEPSIPDNRLLGIANTNKMRAIDSTEGQSKVFGDSLEESNPTGIWRPPGINHLLNAFVLRFDTFATASL